MIVFLLSILQKTLKKDHFLWQLWNIANDIEKADEDADAERRSQQELVQELSDYEHECSIKKKEQAKYLKEIVQCEKKIAEKNSRLDKNVSLCPCQSLPVFSSFGCANL